MALVITLFIMAVILLFAEIFVPGLILGAIGLMLLIASIAVGWMQFPEYGLFIAISEILGAGVVVGIAMYLFFTGKTGVQVALESTQDAAAGWRSFDIDPSLVGSIGKAHTALRPAGTIFVGDQRLDAVSSGTYIDKGTRVKIVEIEGHRVVVERDEESPDD